MVDGFVHILLPQDAQITGLEQLPEGDALQVQILPGEGVDVPETHPLIIGRLINLNEGRQRPVQLLGKVLPGGVPGAGQGDEFAGEIDPPAAVCCGELIVNGLRLVLQGEVPGRAGNFRGGNFLPGAVLRNSSRMASWKSTGGFAAMARISGKRNWQITSIKLIFFEKPAGLLRKHRVRSFHNGCASFLLTLLYPHFTKMTRLWFLLLGMEFFTFL